MTVELQVLHGSLDLRSKGTGVLDLETPVRLNAGQRRAFEVQSPASCSWHARSCVGRRERPKRGEEPG